MDCLWKKYQNSKELKLELQVYKGIIERMQKNHDPMTIDTLNNYLGITTNKKVEEMELKKMSIAPNGFVDFMRSCIAKEKLAHSTEKHKYGTIDAMLRYGRLSSFNQIPPTNSVAFDEFLHGIYLYRSNMEH